MASPSKETAAIRPDKREHYLFFAGGVCIMRLCRRCSAAAAARLLLSFKCAGVLARVFGLTHGKHAVAVAWVRGDS
jgi:hypothetical protein